MGIKQPLIYYGGKKNMSNWIISKFPLGYEKMHYIEPFFGGGSVYFKKEKSKFETINDIDPNLITFYKILKSNSKDFYQKINETLITEKLFYKCIKQLNSPEKLSDLDIAFNYFIKCNFSFLSDQKKFTIRFKTKNSNCFSILKNHNNKIKNIKIFSDRLSMTQVLNQPALKILHSIKNESNTLIYCDPPYPDADQGPYKGFTRQDFRNLIYALSTIKGKFLLSCYKKPWMQFPKNWNFSFYKKAMFLKQKHKNIDRQECLIRNF